MEELKKIILELKNLYQNQVPTRWKGPLMPKHFKRHYNKYHELMYLAETASKYKLDDLTEEIIGFTKFLQQSVNENFNVGLYNAHRGDTSSIFSRATKLIEKWDEFFRSNQDNSIQAMIGQSTSLIGLERCEIDPMLRSLRSKFCQASEALFNGQIRTLELAVEGINFDLDVYEQLLIKVVRAENRLQRQLQEDTQRHQKQIDARYKQHVAAAAQEAFAQLGLKMG